MEGTTGTVTAVMVGALATAMEVGGPALTYLSIKISQLLQYCHHDGLFSWEHLPT